MDPFEVRMQFLTLLRRLNASQPSIQKVVSYALKYFTRCGEDLWDCIIEECQKGNINHRINILYFLDALCESCLLAKSHPAAFAPDVNNLNSSLYVDYLARDLATVIEYVVPEGRLGLPNLLSTKQILENWRTKRFLDPHLLTSILTTLNTRNALLDSTSSQNVPNASNPTSAPSTPLKFSKSDVFKRIEEDRERHKRLRERRWVQPTSHQTQFAPGTLASFYPLGDGDEGENEEELTIDVEFDNEWEQGSDWNEDDEEAVMEENEMCFGEGGSDAGRPMDVL